MPVLKRVSADEAHAKATEKRKDILRDTAAGVSIMKAAKAPASWNEEQRSARFVMTTQQIDRYGDIVVTAGGDLTEFLRNPVGLLFHNSRSWPVASWANVEVLSRTRPPRMEGDFALLPEGGPVKEVDECAWMIANGGIRACSIGFIPDWDDIELIYDDDEGWLTGFQFNKWELTECSVCAVPANAGALIKSAHGDMNLAKELLEDVLDNWVKTPEGLLLSRADFEATHKDITADRTHFIVNKDLAPTVGKFIERDKATVSAETEDEAREYVGAWVVLDPAHPENKDYPFDVLARSRGEVIASFIVDDGPKKGVHGLAVEFLTDDWSGMFRGIEASRFLLAKKKIEDADVQDEQSEKDINTVELTVDVDTSSIEKATEATGNLETTIDRVEKRLDGLMLKISKFFGADRHKDVETVLARVEPEMEVEQEVKSPPTEEDIESARAKAAAVRERLIQKGMIAA
ncbi:prohead serine protease [Rhizobium azibense]|uniref:Prohead serine protease n=2 Tax=Rhizobium azibense TaxID=1136135 RepID=A0A4R3RHL2_9HYPH|nr:prohead serine protease [Rhizobium azibense]